MQTLTRLLGRLWRVMFIPGHTPRTHRPESAGSPHFCSPEAGKNPRRSLCDRPLSVRMRSITGSKSPAADPDDIAFCAWMYYLN